MRKKNVCMYVRREKRKNKKKRLVRREGQAKRMFCKLTGRLGRITVSKMCFIIRSFVFDFLSYFSFYAPNKFSFSFQTGYNAKFFLRFNKYPVSKTNLLFSIVMRENAFEK